MRCGATGVAAYRQQQTSCHWLEPCCREYGGQGFESTALRRHQNPCCPTTGVDVDEVFTTDESATPVSVASWGFLGDTWPFFRPNFVNMDKHREERRAEEVGNDDNRVTLVILPVRRLAC